MERCSAYEADNDFEYRYVSPNKLKPEPNKGMNNFIQSEIEKISQDLEWLSSRIKKMELFNQFVPDRMYQSQAFKRDRIKILTKLKEQLEAISKNDKKIKSAEKSPAPPKKTKKKPLDEKAISERIKKFGLEDWLELVKDKNSLTIKNKLPILFASGSAQIVEEYKVFLKNVAMVLKGYKIKIMADGYTDADPIHTAEYSSNLELGTARAKNVSKELIKNGINPSVFKIGTISRNDALDKKTSKWKTLDRHVNLAIFFQP